MNDHPSQILAARQRERETAIGNLERLIEILSIQRDVIQHAIKVIKESK